MQNKSSFVLLIIGFFLVSTTLIQCKSNKPKTVQAKTNKYKFDFTEESVFTNVLSKAEAEKKLIFVDMSAKWCVPCQLMKRDVYTHQETADFFNNNFISYLVDAEEGEGPDLRVIFGVEEYPTLLIVNEKGRVVSRRVGGIYHNDLVAFAKEALAK